MKLKWIIILVVVVIVLVTSVFIYLAFTPDKPPTIPVFPYIVEENTSYEIGPLWPSGWTVTTYQGLDWAFPVHHWYESTLESLGWVIEMDNWGSDYPFYTHFILAATKDKWATVVWITDTGNLVDDNQCAITVAQGLKSGLSQLIENFSVLVPEAA